MVYYTYFPPGLQKVKKSSYKNNPANLKNWCDVIFYHISDMELFMTILKKIVSNENNHIVKNYKATKSTTTDFLYFLD